MERVRADRWRSGGPGAVPKELEVGTRTTVGLVVRMKSQVRSCSHDYILTIDFILFFGMHFPT